MHVVGVDGCPGGWVAAIWEVGTPDLDFARFATFKELLAATTTAAAIGVDIPIGLTIGPRQCDVEARKFLGPRRSSVFPAPDPRIVNESTFDRASARAIELTGKGISKQAFAIFPKIAEVNGLIRPDAQDRVFEVHPEVSFCELGSGPMEDHKGTPEGYAQRRDLLQQKLGVAIPDRKDAFAWKRPAKPDDILDAIVAAWSASRVAVGIAHRISATPQLAKDGLRAEINF